MPRTARLVSPEVPLHIVHRGLNQRQLFYGLHDYLRYIRLLVSNAQAYHCDIHAYCLMPNHIHLLITPHSQRAPALLMKTCAQQYARYINTAFDRSGPLWDSRYTSCLVDNDSYVLACYRYIEDNPVRAGMVTTPASYPWSSYLANAEQDHCPWITPHPSFLELCNTKQTRCAVYRNSFQTPCQQVQAAIRKATRNNFAFGETSFLERHLAADNRRRSNAHRKISNTT
ncbi:transposase [Umboniibacter marinipuniceus]|uniref:Putative transposase n=1 Tax=Umboniibacter marinipuniceus TaxID=569599 RepID=A0A3M0AKB5_9GAMM|nr:transposase [Umboniibacter marinipuniceus]RMA79512.1 putative transposase [Umboniibacter marinipuniceus]